MLALVNQPVVFQINRKWNNRNKLEIRVRLLISFNAVVNFTLRCTSLSLIINWPHLKSTIWIRLIKTFQNSLDIEMHSTVDWKALWENQYLLIQSTLSSQDFDLVLWAFVIEEQIEWHVQVHRKQIIQYEQAYLPH